MAVVRQELNSNADLPPVEAVDELNPRQEMDRYFDLRQVANAEPEPDPATVARIQCSVEAWLRQELEPSTLPYGQYSEVAVARFRRLSAFLRQEYGSEIPESVLAASEAFITMATDMYEATPSGEAIDANADGSFGFIVPARTSRDHPQTSTETIEPCPSLRYVPDSLRVAMYAGLPPFVVDRYAVDNFGKQGFMIHAPVFPDMAHDMGSQTKALRATRNMVDQAVFFGHNMLGIHVFGLGASLPGLTDYGRTVREVAPSDVVITTGHGGTAALILKTIDALEAEGDTPQVERIGVLGTGAIGKAVAAILRAQYPGAQITLYDKRAARTASTASELRAMEGEGRVLVAENEIQVLGNSDIIVSAITGEVDLSQLGAGSLKGKVVIEDSQPAVFHSQQVQQLGGRLVWVIGEDGPGNTAQRRTGWDYGGTLLPGAIFGCEAEAAALARLFQIGISATYPINEAQGALYRAEALNIINQLAVTGEVTVADAEQFVRVFDALGVGVAPFQAEGEAVKFDPSSNISDTIAA